MHCEVIGQQCVRTEHPGMCGGCYHASSAASSVYISAREQMGSNRVTGVVLDPEGNDFSVRHDESAPVTETLIFSIIGNPEEYEGEGLKTIQTPKRWGLGRKRFPILMQGNITQGRTSLTNYAP